MCVGSRVDDAPCIPSKDEYSARCLFFTASRGVTLVVVHKSSHFVVFLAEGLFHRSLGHRPRCYTQVSIAIGGMVQIVVLGCLVNERREGEMSQRIDICLRLG